MFKNCHIKTFVKIFCGNSNIRSTQAIGLILSIKLSLPQGQTSPRCYGYIRSNQAYWAFRGHSDVSQPYNSPGVIFAPHSGDMERGEGATGICLVEIRMLLNILQLTTTKNYPT